MYLSKLASPNTPPPVPSASLKEVVSVWIIVNFSFALFLGRDRFLKREDFCQSGHLSTLQAGKSFLAAFKLVELMEEWQWWDVNTSPTSFLVMVLVVMMVVTMMMVMTTAFKFIDE